MAEEQIILEFIPDTSKVDASLNEIAKGITDELNKVGNKDFLKGVSQGIKEETKNVENLSKSIQGLTENEKKAKKELDAFAKSMNTLAQGVAGGAIKQGTENIAKIGTAATKTANETTGLTTQLRAMREQLARLDEGSAEFQALSIEAAKLEDKIGDVSRRIRTLSSDTFAIDAVVDSARAVAGAFAIAQGAAALFGDENKDLQKALLKVQASLAVLNGLQETSNFLTGQSAGKLAIVSAAQRVYGFVVGTSTGALKAFKIALAATGVGLAVIAIGTLVANWDKLKKLITDTSEEGSTFRKVLYLISPAIYVVAKAIQFVNNNLEEIKETIAGVGQVFNFVFSKIGEAAGKIAKGDLPGLVDVFEGFGAELADAFERGRQERQEELANENTKKNLATHIRRQKLLVELLEAQGKETYEIEKDILESEILLLDEKADHYIEVWEKLRNDLAILEAKRAIQIQQALEEERKLLELRNLLKFDAGDFAPSGDEDVARMESSRQRMLKIDEEFNREVRHNAEKTDEKQREIDEERLKRQKEINEAILQSVSILFDTIFTISSQKRNAEFEAELEKLNAEREAALNSKERTEKQKAVINERFRKKEAQIKEEQFRAEKRAAIIKATIETALAVARALPNFVLAGLAAIAGAAQIAVITSQPVPKFKKGTKSAPGGTALVGEEGAELMYVPKGAKIVPHAETMKVLSGHPDTNEILSRFNIPVTSAKVETLKKDFSGYDFSRLEKMLEKGNRNFPQVHVDKNGIVTLVNSENSKRTYFGDRYSTG